MDTPVIDVRAQHHIPLGKALALCLKGISHRFLRSSLTLMVIVLAVAFFMSLLCESAFARSVAHGVATENLIARFSQRSTADWFDPVSRVVMASRLVAAHAAPDRLSEIRAITNVDDAQGLQSLADRAEREAQVMRFFDSMDAGSRAALVGNAKGEGIYTLLTQPGAWDEFAEKLRHLYSLRPPMSMAEFKNVIDGHQALAAAETALAAKWQQANDGLQQDMADHQLARTRADDIAMLVRGEPGQLADFQHLLAAHGFHASLSDVQRVHAQLALAAQEVEVRRILQGDDARAAWHKAFLVEPLIDEKMISLDDPRVPAVLGGGWTQAQLREISSTIAADARRLAVEQAVSSRISADEGAHALLSGRQAFLMSISFVVCMVGITNAMLMAITERFREIATMKCLGATDGFILQQFMIEAAMQGVVGGFAGMLIGFILSMAKCSVIFGSYLYIYFPLMGVLIAGGVCLITGIALSTLASIYPSWMASRMAPMEAMRIE